MSTSLTLRTMGWKASYLTLEDCTTGSLDSQLHRFRQIEKLKSSPFRSQEVPVMTGAKTLGSAKRLAGLDLGLSKNRGGCRTCYFNGKMENHHNLLELGYPICRQADKPIFHHLCTSALLERTQPRLGQSCLKSMASRILAAWHWLSFFKHVTYSWFWSCCFYSYV